MERYSQPAFSGFPSAWRGGQSQGYDMKKVGVLPLGRENQQGVFVRGSAAGAGRGVIAGKMAVKAPDLTYYGLRSGGFRRVIDIIIS